MCRLHTWQIFSANGISKFLNRQMDELNERSRISNRQAVSRTDDTKGLLNFVTIDIFT